MNEPRVRIISLVLCRYRQRDWSEWLETAEFSVNNKIYSVIKVSLFIANYGRELQMRTDIRRKKKIKKVMEFAERMKKSTRESRSNIKKGLGRDGVTSR